MMSPFFKALIAKYSPVFLYLGEYFAIKALKKALIAKYSPVFLYLARMTLPKWPLPRTATKWKLSSPIPASDRIGRDGRWGWLGESRGLAGWKEESATAPSGV